MPNAQGKSADIYAFGKNRFPEVDDYAALCKRLLELTFPAPSLNQMCNLAARATGEDADKFYRIWHGQTKSPCGRLMLALMAIYNAKHHKPV